MFKVICDKCGKDCDKVSTFIEVKRITNYAISPKDIGDPQGTTTATMQMALCKECYAQLGLPNIYDKGNILT